MSWRVGFVDSPHGIFLLRTIIEILDKIDLIKRFYEEIRRKNLLVINKKKTHAYDVLCHLNVLSLILLFSTLAAEEFLVISLKILIIWSRYHQIIKLIYKKKQNKCVGICLRQINYFNKFYFRCQFVSFLNFIWYYNARYFFGSSFRLAHI